MYPRNIGSRHELILDNNHEAMVADKVLRAAGQIAIADYISRHIDKDADHAHALPGPYASATVSAMMRFALADPQELEKHELTHEDSVNALDIVLPYVDRYGIPAERLV